jgi:hypothetical protein
MPKILSEFDLDFHKLVAEQIASGFDQATRRL